MPEAEGAPFETELPPEMVSAAAAMAPAPALPVAAAAASSTADWLRTSTTMAMPVVPEAEGAPFETELPPEMVSAAAAMALAPAPPTATGVASSTADWLRTSTTMAMPVVPQVEGAPFETELPPEMVTAAQTLTLVPAPPTVAVTASSAADWRYISAATVMPVVPEAESAPLPSGLSPEMAAAQTLAPAPVLPIAAGAASSTADWIYVSAAAAMPDMRHAAPSYRVADVHEAPAPVAGAATVLPAVTAAGGLPVSAGPASTVPAAASRHLRPGLPGPSRRALPDEAQFRAGSATSSHPARPAVPAAMPATGRTERLPEAVPPEMSGTAPVPEAADAMAARIAAAVSLLPARAGVGSGAFTAPALLPASFVVLAVPGAAGAATPLTATQTAPRSSLRFPPAPIELAMPPEPHAADILPQTSVASSTPPVGRTAGPIRPQIRAAQLPETAAPSQLDDWLQAAAHSVPKPQVSERTPYAGAPWAAGQPDLQHPAPSFPVERQTFCTGPVDTLPSPFPAAPCASMAIAPAAGWIAPAAAANMLDVPLRTERIDRQAGPCPLGGLADGNPHPAEPAPWQWAAAAGGLALEVPGITWPPTELDVLEGASPRFAEPWPGEYYVQHGRPQSTKCDAPLLPRLDIRLPQFRAGAVPLDLQKLIRHDERPELAQRPDRRSAARWNMPTWAKGVAAGIALCSFLWVGSSALRQGVRPQQAPATVALNLSPQKASGGFVSRVRQALASRATLELANDFHSGKSFWDGTKAGWGGGWQRHPDGFVRPGALALFSPTLHLTDYRMEFMAQIESKSVGWVFRAHDVGNYYAMKLHVLEPGLRPVMSVVRYPVVNGKRGRRVEIPLPVMMHNNTPYRVAVEVRGNQFVASVEGETVDTWTDDALKTGGVGFFSDTGERARLYWMKVTNNDDLLGHLCAYLAGMRTGTAGGEERAFTTGYADRDSGSTLPVALPAVAWIDPRSRYAGAEHNDKAKRG
jgi:hypothetical protein